MSRWHQLRSSLAFVLTSRIFTFVSLVILGVVGYLLWHERQVLEKELQSRGLLTAAHLAQQALDPILREDDYALFKLVQLLRKTRRPDTAEEGEIVYAIILDTQGQVLAHTDPAEVHLTSQDPRTTEILSRPESSLRPLTGPRGERLYDVAIPIRMRGVPVGAVRLGISRAGVDRLYWSLAAKVFGVLFVLMLVGIGSIWRFSGRTVQPIRRLRDSARAVQAGDLTRRVPVDRTDEIGQLASAFNAMTAELERSRAELTFETNLRTGPRLEGPLETALYRIAQEALTNVARHAGASTVSVVLEAGGGSVTLIVEDDGRGLDVATCMSGTRDERCLGLFGMRERATLLGGTLTIESIRGGGTTIFVELPLPTGTSNGGRQADSHSLGG